MSAIIVTNSGRYVDLANPQPDMICIEDIAHHLSYINRFTGAANRGYSVASHSLYVANLVEPKYQLQALLHDATEAYLGDVSSPLKSILPGYRLLERQMHAAIAAKFGIEPILPEEVHHADRQAYVRERSILFDKGAPACDDPDYAVYGSVEMPTAWLVSFSPEAIKDRFMRKFNELYASKDAA